MLSVPLPDLLDAGIDGAAVLHAVAAAARQAEDLVDVCRELTKEWLPAPMTVMPLLRLPEVVKERLPVPVSESVLLMLPELVRASVPKPLMVMPLLTLPEVTRVSTSMALKVMVCMLPAVVTVSWFITEAENGPLKLVPTRTSTVSVLSPEVVKPDGLPVQVTVAPEVGGSGLHCAIGR